jgi:hypothetical protein
MGFTLHSLLANVAVVIQYQSQAKATFKKYWRLT